MNDTTRHLKCALLTYVCRKIALYYPICLLHIYNINSIAMRCVFLDKYYNDNIQMNEMGRGKRIM
jgi:hypothetical protein